MEKSLIQSPLEDWKVINLELIAFPLEPAVAIDQEWWSELTDQEGESLRKKNERVDSGEFRGTSLRLAIDVLRIRFGIGPRLEVDPAEGFVAPPDIGPYGTAVAWFVPLMEKWLRESCPPIKRLAFAGKLIHWTEGREEAYKTLARFLPSVQIDLESREFQYRINRPRASSHASDFLVNRLSTWSAVKFEMQMQMSAGGGKPQQIAQSFDGCMLQLDINTPMERESPIPPGDLTAAWTELASFAHEIALHGDCR